MTIREPEWTDLDRSEVLALALYRAHLCPCGCGHQFADTTSHEATGPQFRASRVMCRARAAQLEAERALTDGATANPDAAARLWSIHKMRG